uniref:outer dense fiber protein 3-like protein 1 n=1 Tax=Euleptes europaea TaxID=460621 RepID=UPI00253F9592|nr:outer dense fiber protein 3-like protein 1 [Euleptes europaea]
MATPKQKGRKKVHILPKLSAKARAADGVYASISAKFKGPGPGKYSRQPCTGLKDHDFTKYAEPAFTMRVKSSEKMISVNESPGPCYYVDPSISHLGIWRPFSYRMAKESKSTSAIPTPAPNQYYVENMRPLEEPNAPAYTIGLRTRYWENSPYPAPNRYTLPGTLGPRLTVKQSAPCLSMGTSASVWGSATDRVKGPGPAAHTLPHPDFYLHCQPSYSLSQRFQPSTKEYMPGPPDYNAERVTLHKPKAPRFSLGIRHSEYSHGTPTVCLIQD